MDIISSIESIGIGETEGLYSITIFDVLSVFVYLNLNLYNLYI